MSENPSGGWDGENKPNALAEYASEIARLRAETEAQRREIERLTRDRDDMTTQAGLLAQDLAALAVAQERMREVLIRATVAEDTDEWITDAAPESCQPCSDMITFLKAVDGLLRDDPAWKGRLGG